MTKKEKARQRFMHTGGRGFLFSRSWLSAILGVILRMLKTDGKADGASF